MPPSVPGNSAPLNLWPIIAQSDPPTVPVNPEGLRTAAAKLSTLVSPVLTDFLLSPVEGRADQKLVDPEAVKQDHLMKRFTLAQHGRWARAIVTANIDVVFIKGFANAHTLYPDPSLRIQGDLDVLVRPADFRRLVDFLVAQGFSNGAADNNAWGMISDASFLPFVSADGVSHIDVHIHPDSYPVHRSLTTDLVFALSCQLTASGVTIRVPDDSHCLLLCVTNAAKDKFNISSLGKVIDAIMVLRNASRLDWDHMVDLATDGRFLLPLRAFLALLSALGAPMGGIPRDLYRPLGGLRGLALRQVLHDFRSYFPQELPLTALWWREMALCAEPSVALHNAGLRLKGVFRPSSGHPWDSPATASLPMANCSNPGP